MVINSTPIGAGNVLQTRPGFLWACVLDFNWFT